MKTQLFIFAFVINLTALITSTNSQAQFNEFLLIEHETIERTDKATALNFYEHLDAVSRFREVELNESIKSLYTVAEEDLIVLNLFSDVEYVAIVQRVEEIMEDNVTITAKFISYDFSYAYISTTEDRTLVTIHVPEEGRQYEITSDPVSLEHYLIEIDPTALPVFDDHPSLTPPDLTPDDIKEQKRIEQELEMILSGPSDPASIDVMMIYTPAARNWGNTHGGGIRNLIATAVASGNTALSNSATIATIRLVHNGEISYTEYTGDAIWYGSPYNFWASGPEVDLIRLTEGTHGFATAHTWRNTYGADLVQLFSTMGGGIAWVLNSTGGQPAWGFSIAGAGSVAAFTPIHEMGHNMGCGHHKEQNFQPGPKLYTYSAGWRWQGTDNVWYSSIMSYTSANNFPSNPVNSIRVGHFSNPSVNYMGVATGHAADGDNARTIRNTKHVVAAYNSTSTIPCIECPGYNFTINPGNSWSTHASSIAYNGCKSYRIAVEKGRTYTFKTGCGNGATANFDTFLQLLDNNCAIITTDDDGCENNRSIIEWQANYDGYAYLVVRGYSAAHYGSYTMAYQRNDDLTWTGLFTTSWHLAANWNGNVVPDNTFNVIIPGGTTRQPYISAANAYCKNLTINSGGTLTVGGYTLYVNNDLTINGTLAMNNSAGVISANGNVTWGSGSTANFSANTVFWVYGDWVFQSGSNANLANGVVAFLGYSNKYVISYSSGSSFNNISSYKTSGNEIGISAWSTHPLTINGNIYVHSNAQFGIYSSYDVILKGNVNSNSTFICNYGTVVLNGSNQNLRMNTGNYFNNLTFNQSGTVSINNALSNIVDVRGNVVISSGVFNMQDRVVHVGGNWTNNAFPTGFNAGTGRVIFNRASGHQYIYSSENFNILEVDMNAAIRVTNAAHTVTCNQYDWKKGGIDVIAGTFTANDLAQNGIFGGYWLNPGGTINLTNTAGYVDLNGHLYIFGGNFNVYGGTTTSYWPYLANASISMSGGVLDFKDQGVRIHNTASYTLTENITGGTIKSSRGFTGLRSDFTPSAGTFEFYGSGDYLISQENGCTLHNLKINQSAKESSGNYSAGKIYDERSGIMLSEGGKANTIILNSNLTITGNLDIDAGTFSIGQYTCNVGGNINISGSLAMTNAAGVINANQSVSWKMGSTADFSAMAVFNVYGWWEFLSGSNANLANGVVAFRGSDERYVRNYSETSSFNNISSYKTTGVDFGISSWSTQPLTINGNIYVHPGAKFGIYSIYDINLKGDVNSNGEFICNAGTVVLNGVNQSLRLNAGNYFYHLAFNQSGTVTINNSLSNILNVTRNVEIQSGVFNMQDRIMHVGGNWTNNAGTAAFNEGTGRVIFNGTGNQTCNSETFNILEVNKTSGTLNFPGTTVCATYDWTAGGITVSGGTFTALNLMQTTIVGSYTVQSNGTINLHQDATKLVDLDASISISSGTMNIFGGVPGSSAWWPYSSASLTMSGGVLDVKDQTIIVRESGSFTANISGGTIRTSKGYSGNRPDFTPTAGTFEFYSSDNAFISQSNGSTLHNVVINKSSKHGEDKKTPVVTHCKRDGTLLSDGGKSNMISLFTDFTVTNNVDINNGSLDLAGKTLNVENNMSVYGTLNMTNENDLLNIGQSYYNWLWFYEGSTANMTHGTIYCTGWVVPGAGSQFDLGIHNTIYFTGASGGGMSSYEPTTSYGNIVFSKNSGEIGFFDFDATQPAHVKGFFNVAPGNTFFIQNHSLSIDGTCDWDPTSSVYLAYYDSKKGEGNYFTGTGQSLPAPKTTGFLEMNSAFNLKGLLDVANGNVLLTDAFGIADTGILSISGGSVINNCPYNGTWTDIYGTLNMTDGLFELTNNHPQFYSSAATNISGGIIRTGGAFAALEAPVFQPAGGTVEITGNQPASLIYCYGGNFFHNLVINRTDFYSQFALGEPVSIQNNFDVDNGEIQSWASAVSVSGNTSVNANGKLVINRGTSLLIAGNKSLTINDSGILDVSGTLDNKAVISGISKSHFAFNVESGATIGAEHGIFEYMDANGVNIKPGALVEHARAFTHCSFRNGQGGGNLLTINNDQVFSVHHAEFPENTWGGLYNVSKTENSGQVEFKHYTGDFSGSSFENDIHNRIDWFEPLLTADPLLRNVTPPAGTTTFDIISNLTWTITESVGWLEVSHTWGSNNETITVTYEANPSPDARIGYITLSADYAPDVTLTVIQSGVSLAVLPPTRDVGTDAGTTNFFVTSNTGWTVSESVLWLSVAPMSGNGNAELIVTYDANTESTPRSGSITVSAAGAPNVIVSVNQEGASEIPVNLLVNNEIVNNGESECYDALQTITVQNFVVESGGEANLIAGENIIMLAGTHAKTGSYLHARITTTGDFCGSVISMLAAEDLDKGVTQEEMPMPDQLPDDEQGRVLFRVFPNPTTGMFTLELAEAVDGQTCSMEIYTLVGERVMSDQLDGHAQHQFDLTFRPKGIYIVRVTVGEQVGIEKLVKH